MRSEGANGRRGEPEKLDYIVGRFRPSLFRFLPNCLLPTAYCLLSLEVRK